MAKAALATTAAIIGATASIGAFNFDVDLPVPAMTRGASRTSDMGEKLKAMPVGASFLEAVTVPETIKDDAERAKVFKEKTRSVSNRLSGSVRRFKKSNPDYDFVLRTVEDDKLGFGVRVWRVAVPVAAADAGAAA